MRALGFYKCMPKSFEKMVKEYGDPSAQAPSGFGNEGKYVSTWNNNWLVKRLYDQWRYVHAIATGKKPASSWFYEADQKPNDWRTTAMHVMNSEYAGNASYEWFDWYVDEDGEKHMQRINWFDSIKDVNDHRLRNPALAYLFSHPEKTVAAAFAEFKKEHSSQKNN